jgi:Na+/proline symporter
MWIEFVTIAAYFVLLLVIGGIFARFNRNLSDYVRGGAQGTWWMVGSSMLMAGISAFTFTGNGSAVFTAGPTPMIIYAANLLGFIIGGLWLARWFRQSRAYTSGDILRDRFGPVVEKTFVGINVFLAPFAAAIQLWALSLFVSSTFGLPLTPLIIAIGLITLAYSTSGGLWAVMATDVLQGVLLYGMTILVAVLCVIEVGGFSGFFAHYSAPELAEAYRFVKPPGTQPQDRFTWHWIAMVFTMQLISQVHMASGSKYLAAKDGREAARASWMGGVLMLVGSVVWFIPPMVARFLYAPEVLAAPISDPATTAYAVAARHVLPNGLLGLLIAAMFAATMSSIDMGLNNQTGLIVRNLIEPARRALRRPALTDRAALLLCRFISIVLGALIISVAIVLSNQSKFILFDAYLVIGSVIVVPLTLPLVAGIVIRRMPSWCYFTMFIGGMIPSIYSLIDERTNQTVWTVQDRSLWVLAGALVALLLSLPFRHLRSPANRASEVAFWQRVKTPIDYAQEIGASVDVSQAQIMARLVLLTGALMLLFLLIPNPAGGRLAIAALATFVMLCGYGLHTMARRTARRAAESSPLVLAREESDDSPAVHR